MFSACTQGSIHELWAHCTTDEDDDRMYYMKMVKSCNMAVDCEVPGFLEAVDNVMKWGLGGHVDKVANQLKSVWAAVKSGS